MSGQWLPKDDRAQLAWNDRHQVVKTVGAINNLFIAYDVMKAGVLKALEKLDAAGVWTGADDDLEDRIQHLIIERDGYQRKLETCQQEGANGEGRSEPPGREMDYNERGELVWERNDNTREALGDAVDAFIDSATRVQELEQQLAASEQAWQAAETSAAAYREQVTILRDGINAALAYRDYGRNRLAGHELVKALERAAKALQQPDDAGGSEGHEHDL